MERRAILAPLPAVLGHDGAWAVGGRSWLACLAIMETSGFFVGFPSGFPTGLGAAVGDGNGLRGRQCSAPQGWLYCLGRLRHIVQDIVAGRDGQHYSTLSVISTINSLELIQFWNLLITRTLVEWQAPV